MGVHSQKAQAEHPPLADAHVAARAASIELQPAKEQSAAFYRPELDWLRFVAFSAVFLVHAFPNAEIAPNAHGVTYLFASLVVPLVRSGGYGVDLFFALSAFLITELLLREKEATGKVHIGSFYVRRILRIWPLYFTFVLSACAIEVYSRANPISFYAALLGFSGNWYSVLYDQHFLSACVPLWSVCVEEQFYIVWPNVVGRLKPTRFAMIMIIALVFTCVYRTIYVYGMPRTPACVWFNTFTRLDPFALGGLLAIFLHKHNFTLSRPVRIFMLLMAVATFWILGVFPDAGQLGTAPVWSYPIVALASVLCIFSFVSSPPRRTFSRPLRVLAYLGKISYGLYVFHYGAIIFVHSCYQSFLLEEPADIWFRPRRAIFAAILTLALSMASYAWLEKPFLKLKERFAYVQSRPA